MKLHIIFQDKSFIEIILFQNDAVTKWFKHFQKFTSNKNYYRLGHEHSSRWINQSSGVIDQDWNEIQSAISELESLGYQLPWSIPTTFDFQQKTLNQLHRFFTYNVLWYHELYNNPTKQNPFDPQFKLPPDINFQQWLGIVSRINTSVHNLEHFTVPHENKTFICNQYPLSFLAFFPIRSDTDLDPWLVFTEEEQVHNFTDYFANDSLQVILDRSILGKSVLQSFYENDDPNAHDCTGRLGSYGGFEIELDQNKKQIYQSDQFIQWAASHGRTVESLPLEFPIGYIKDPHTLLNELHGFKYKFKTVEFVD